MSFSMILLLVAWIGTSGQLPFENLIELFEDTQNSKDLEATLSLFDENACLICSSSGPLTCGIDQIRRKYRNFFSDVLFLADRRISPIYDDHNHSAAFIKSVAVSVDGLKSVSRPVAVAFTWNDRMLIQELFCLGSYPPYAPAAPLTNFTELVANIIEMLNARDIAAFGALFDASGCIGRISNSTAPYACGPDAITALISKHMDNATFSNTLVISPLIIDGAFAALEIFGAAAISNILEGTTLFARKLMTIEVLPSGKIKHMSGLMRWA